MKRQRGRGRKPGGGGGNYHHNQGGGHPNRQMESNGPETKVRGPASHINERYLQLARDAASAGDRVLSENYLQHADHYFRLWRSMQPAIPVQQQQNFSDGGAEFEGDDGGPESEGVEESEARAEGDEQPDIDYPQQGDRQREGDGDGEGGRRRRGRNRNRFRPEGEREGGYEAREGEERGGRSEGGEPREAREPREREPRRERQPREDREAGSREGFSDGPKPAFLRGGGE